MFTGIVQGLCTIVKAQHTANLFKLAINLQELAKGLEAGSSVAVNGVCLTATSIVDSVVAFDVITTSQSTNLSSLTVGSKANIERSMRLQDEIGGHLVSGHVCGCVEVLAAVLDQGPDERCWLSCPEIQMKYIFHKGFVAIDGASLTVSAVRREALQFAVDLIPETIARTTLATCQAGDLLNLEADQQTRSIVDTIERLAEGGAIKFQ